MVIAEKHGGARALPIARGRSRTFAGVAALLGIALGAFVLRVLFIGQQSAYMDENSNILIGRYLIERQTVYADALRWSYGSYLWALLAGAADILGGLTLVRTLTALFGALMTVATGLTAAALAPPTLTARRRWTIAAIAGLIMAICPTAIGVGRFASYDAMAGAAFMLGIAALVQGLRVGRWSLFPLAALALFVAFLAKYVVAIFFPFICIYLMVSPRSRAAFARNMAGFVVPLTAICAIYFVAFQEQLRILLSFSTEYTDLASATPLRVYLWQRPEVWILAALAALGWRGAPWLARFLAAGGTGIILAFQAYSRADYDFWKHSIYVIFFCAPLAALALQAPVERLLALIGPWPRSTQRHPFMAALATVVLGVLLGAGLLLGGEALAARGTLDLVIRRASLALAVAAIAALAVAPLFEMRRERTGGRLRPPALLAAVLAAFAVGLAAAPALAESSKLVTFYPNLNPSLAAIDASTVGVRNVLTDDSAVRYYLYPRLLDEQVVDPFYLLYKGREGDAAYRLAITDRYFDRIILTGGIGPNGGELENRHGQLIAESYEQIYANDGKEGAPVRIYRPRVGELSPPDARSTVYHFDTDTRGWGARTNDAGLQPGAQVASDGGQRWEGHASLRFATTPSASTIGVVPQGSVRTVVAWVYIEDSGGVESETRVGMTGFDANWHWRDDGFGQTVLSGRWTRLVWTLAEPGTYQEIGLAFPEAAGKTVYIGQVEIQP